MLLQFFKYQGTGNDFVMIDNRNLIFPKDNTHFIAQLCNRKFGIGADGLLLLENEDGVDFKMVYYNADGNESTMCGNGGRCLVAFAKQLGVIQNKTTFMAIDGVHHATIDENHGVSLQMIDVDDITISDDYVFLNTGSPHHVTLVDQLKNYNVKQVGATIRNSSLYGKEGSNINFVAQISENHFAIRTYERGVEDETLSCGTGATAVALAMNVLQKTCSNLVDIDVEGGKLQIAFDRNGNEFTNIFLKGPAQFVFEGQIALP